MRSPARTAAGAALAVLIAVRGAVHASPAPELPLQPVDGGWPALEELLDPKLQADLERVVNADRKRALLVSRKRLAVGVIDLSQPDHVRFARLNGRVPLYAASLAKIAILLAAEEAIAEGVLKESPAVRADLNDMIRVSSNEAATRMIDRVGLDRIEASVKRWGLYDESRGGGLWVGKPYGRSDVRIGDPVANLSHGANVVQVCRFYYLLATGRLIDRRYSERMLEVLADPGLHHKFVAALDQRAPKARLFRKSGTFEHWHSDSVIVWGDEWRRYVLVAMVDDDDGEKILRSLLPAVEEILHPSGAPRSP